MGEIFRELQAEWREQSERAAFEAWMTKRGTPLHLEQTQAYEAFKAGRAHERIAAADHIWKAERQADKDARMKLADNDIDGARQFRAVATHLKELLAEWNRA